MHKPRNDTELRERGPSYRGGRPRTRRGFRAGRRAMAIGRVPSVSPPERGALQWGHVLVARLSPLRTEYLAQVAWTGTAEASASTARRHLALPRRYPISQRPRERLHRSPQHFDDLLLGFGASGGR